MGGPSARPLALDDLRFLEQPRFQAAWLTALAALTEQAARLPARHRPRLYPELDALWQLLRLRLRLDPPTPGEAELQAWLPQVLPLTLFARYLQIWRRADDWLVWLSSLYPVGELIHGLAFGAPRGAGLSLKTRRTLLSSGVQLLAELPETPVAPWLEALAELVLAARQLDAPTQQELLLDELRLLLDVGSPAESLATARSLMLLALELREPALARAALQQWRRSWSTSSPEAKRHELPLALGELELLGWRQLDLKLAEISLLQRWLGQMGQFLQTHLQSESADGVESERLLARLLRLGRQWGLPEAESWQQTLWAEPLPTVLALCLPDLWLYSAAPATLLRRLPAQLPDWLCRWGPALLLPLLRHRWVFSPASNPERQALDVLLQLATVLLQAQRGGQGQRQLRRRARLLSWGMEIWQAGLACGELLDEAEARHQAELQRNWLREVLHLAPAELPAVWLQALLAEIPRDLSDWLDWQAQLVLSAQGAAHLSPEQQAQGWEALHDGLERLDLLESLQGLAALAWVCAEQPGPERAAHFARLAALAARVEPDWRGAAQAAVGHCQLRGGDLAGGLTQLAQIAAPTEQLSALLQVGVMLSEAGTGSVEPELLQALLHCAQRQHDVLARWQAHVTVALAQFAQRAPVLGLQSLEAGLAQLPAKAPLI